MCYAYCILYIFIYIIFIMLETIDICIPAPNISVFLFNFPRNNSPSAGCAFARNGTSKTLTIFYQITFF